MPRSGITYSTEYEWYEAAHWAHYTWEAFCDLDGDDQARIVAHFRAHHQIEAVIAKEVERKRQQG